jgi:hypothetical protein
MNQSETITNLSAALVAAQAEMGGAVKDSKNPFFKSNYADLTSVIKAIKEPFANHGLAYIQFPIHSERGIGVSTRIIHESGEWLEQDYILPLTKADPQAAGSAITYARRYSLQAMAGIPAVDDDAEMAMVRQEPTIKSGEAAIIEQMIEATNSDKEKFLKAYGIASVADLKASQYKSAHNALSKKAQMQEQE